MAISESATTQDSHSRPVASVRAALDLLGRASADWRNGGGCESGALHWPVAITLARSELRKVLEALDEHGEESAHPPENCRGGHLDALECFSDEDARAGLAWYNSATVTERRHWHQVARSAVPADAWEAYKVGGPQP